MKTITNHRNNEQTDPGANRLKCSNFYLTNRCPINLKVIEERVLREGHNRLQPGPCDDMIRHDMIISSYPILFNLILSIK